MVPCELLAMQMPNLVEHLPDISVVEFLIYMAIVVPTLYAMIAGAPFVPTPMNQVDRMLKAAKIKPGEKVYDLGCGDGRLVYKAATDYKAVAVGYEYSPFVWFWAWLLKKIAWKSSAKVLLRNFWTQDLRDADVLITYLLPHSMEHMKKLILPQLKKGARVISHAFPLEGVKEVEKLPHVKDERLGAVWIYKI